jgi:hypothetical protein
LANNLLAGDVSLVGLADEIAYLPLAARKARASPSSRKFPGNYEGSGEQDDGNSNLHGIIHRQVSYTKTPPAWGGTSPTAGEMIASHAGQGLRISSAGGFSLQPEFRNV